ncbi:MAG: hypothetical protein IJH39_04390 [Clostridia bacterium]|nr:hypothetical protein [Clostridia bacterium]
MFWFKANNIWKHSTNSYSNNYVKDYSFSCFEDRFFNSNLVHCVFKTDSAYWEGVEARYGTPEYEAERNEKRQKKLFIIYIGNFIIDVKEDIFNKICKECQKKDDTKQYIK